MRGYLSIDFTVSVLVMLTLVTATLYHYSPKFSVFQQSYEESLKSLNETAQHSQVAIGFSVRNTYKASYAYMVPRAFVDAWYSMCIKGFTTLDCRSPTDCRYNDTSLEIRPIAHSVADPEKWCKEQYYQLQMGNKIYTIYRTR